MMELFRQNREGNGGSSAVAETAPEETVVPSEGDLHRTREILDTMIEGAADPEQAAAIRLAEVLKANHNVLSGVFQASFLELEAQWETLEQKIRSGADMTRGNDQEKLNLLEKRLKALGAVIDTLQGSDTGDFSNRARKHRSS